MGGDAVNVNVATAEKLDAAPGLHGQGDGGRAGDAAPAADLMLSACMSAGRTK